MLIDFLYNLKPVFPEEERDFAALCEELAGNSFIGFMPAVKLDLYPIYTLGCTGASRFTGANSLNKVYIAPIDVSDRAIYPELCATVREFYTDEAKPEESKNRFSLGRIFSREKDRSTPLETRFDIEIEEIMPLDIEGLAGSYPLHLSKVCDCNVLYFRLKLPNLGAAHLFFICSSPEKVWQTVNERFEIRTDMIIHSYRGFGHWFSSTPLCKYLTVTKKPHLLPSYYFKGRFITENDAPPLSTELDILSDDARCGDSVIYRMPERFV